MATDVSPNFGLTRVGQGESLSKDGYAALDRDRLTLDALLAAQLQHSHDGAARLGSPVAAPIVTFETGGGSLPAGMTFYYAVSFLDRWGLETAISPEAWVSTPAILPNPAAPSLAIMATGGALGPGRYSYIITHQAEGGGETAGSPASSVQIVSGSANQVAITLPDLPAGAVAARIYRAKPGQSQHHLLGSTDQAAFYDAGSSEEDFNAVSPTTNRAGATGRVMIQVPDGEVPEEAYGWRIYRATAPGSYPSAALVHTVVETTDPTGGPIRPYWYDSGQGLVAGTPRRVSATIGGAVPLEITDMGGRLSVTQMPRGMRNLDVHMPGTLTARAYGRTSIPGAVRPARLTAFFQDPPVGLEGTTPTLVTVRVQDDQVAPAAVELVCADDSGYYEVAWPMTDEATFQAEEGTRSGALIRNDSLASGGQHVELSTQGQYVEVELGLLDEGDYLAYVMLSQSVVVASDVTIEVLDDIDAVLATATVTPGATFTEASVAFAAPAGEVPLRIRVSKATTTTNLVRVDLIRYAAELVTLEGSITTSVLIGGTPTNAGGDVGVVLWF